MKITKNTFVSVAYDLNVGNDNERELMESATKERPLQFIFGSGAMLPAFEDHLQFLEKDSTFNFSLTPDEAYGDYVEDYVVELPKSMFEVNGVFDDEHIVEGATLPMMNENGDRMNGSVLEIKENVVIMDFNHPLAGESLHFNGTILDVHQPTEKEIDVLNRAMAGGCGCSCDGCDDNSGCGNN
jgi:FKBP-type peptidyl-prolyl cis-trans isomerase SlyD